jgi:chromosome partitioning protein
MGKVFLVGGEKGGTGKSTIATNLGVMSELMGHDVILLDSDKQESSAKFISHRNDRGLKPTPPCVQIRGKFLNAEIENLAARYEIVIIDAGGKDSVELRAAMASPSVKGMISPLQPSEFDLETLATMDELVYLSLAYNPNLKAYILFNQCPTHAKITTTKEAIELIESFDNLDICNTSLGHRVAFQYASSNSQAVVEFENQKIKDMPEYQAKKYISKASEEMCNLYQEIFNEKFELNR